MNRPRTLAEHLKAHERLVIIQTLALNAYSRMETARILGISRSHLWSRMRALDIKVPRTSLGGRPKRAT